MVAIDTNTREMPIRRRTRVPCSTSGLPVIPNSLMSSGAQIIVIKEMIRPNWNMAALTARMSLRWAHVFCSPRSMQTRGCIAIASPRNRVDKLVNLSATARRVNVSSPNREINIRFRIIYIRALKAKVEAFTTPFLHMRTNWVN